jgi:hypothetical protein
MRSWPLVSFQIRSFHTKLAIRVIVAPLIFVRGGASAASSVHGTVQVKHRSGIVGGYLGKSRFAMRARISVLILGRIALA